MDDREKYLEAARQNARTISSEIRELSSVDVNSSDSFAKYKDKSQTILDLFKNLKPLLKEDRESLWNSFLQVSNDYRQKQAKRKENRIYASNRKKEIVVSTIREAKAYATGDLESLGKADALLKTANEMMRPGWSDGFGSMEGFFHTSDGKMTKEDTEFCWQYWNEAKENVNSRRKEIFSNNYYNIKSELNSISDLAVYGDPYEALKRIKETRNRIFSHPMSRENKDSLLHSLDSWYQKASERIQEKRKENERKQKEWEQRKAEKEKKQMEWEQKQKEWEEKKRERDRKQKEWEERKLERERKQREWEVRKAERERKQREWEERKAENERKQREWEARKIERERKQREWEERQRDRERKQREWEERKLERERKQQEWEDRKRNRSGGKHSSGGCYITTATCLTLGKPDDCIELTSIRRFRDEWLCNQKNGIEIIIDYYHLAPKIVEVVNGNTNKILIYKYIWETYLLRFFNLIQANQNKEALVIYLKMVNDLRDKYLKFGF